MKVFHHIFFVKKRKITPTKKCRTGSIPLVTENVGQIAKKKFTPRITQRRAKKSESEESKPAQLDRGVSLLQNRGRGNPKLQAQQELQPRPEDVAVETLNSS